MRETEDKVSSREPEPVLFLLDRLADTFFRCGLPVRSHDVLHLRAGHRNSMSTRRVIWLHCEVLKNGDEPFVEWLSRARIAKLQRAVDEIYHELSRYDPSASTGCEETLEFVHGFRCFDKGFLATGHRFFPKPDAELPHARERCLADVARVRVFLGTDDFGGRFQDARGSAQEIWPLRHTVRERRNHAFTRKPRVVELATGLEIESPNEVELEPAVGIRLAVARLLV